MPQNSNQNSKIALNKRLPDNDLQNQAYQIYHTAEKTGNWDAVAEFELSLLLKAVAATPHVDKNKPPPKS